MLKYLNFCLIALFAVASAKPSLISPYGGYSTSLLSAPLTAGYGLPYAGYGAGLYGGAFDAYSPYSVYPAYSPYYSAYSSYPHGSLLLRK